MTTYSTNQNYYRVTWTANSPTDYSNLPGDKAGSVDAVSALGINRTIIATGATVVSGTPMADGETIIINGQTIAFLSTDTLASIIEKINLATELTRVVADQSVAGGFLTLKNAPLFEGVPFYVAEGNGTALTKLGFGNSTYQYAPTEIGTAFSSVTTGSNITINGVNIVFSAGNLASTAGQLNNYEEQTGVKAYVAGPYLQLASITGQPWTINSGNAVSNLGTTLGNHGGYPATLAASEAKERANMRWIKIINDLQENATPNFVGNLTKTGNISNLEVTTLSFTVGYDRPDTIYTVARPTEPDAGNVFVGASAIKRQVARALTSAVAQNREIFDPTMNNYGAYSDRPNSARIVRVTADAIDTLANIAIVENNITVTQISGV